MSRLRLPVKSCTAGASILTLPLIEVFEFIEGFYKPAPSSFLNRVSLAE
jgi:hypothetical protein